MSKEPIELGHSVERHQHHDNSSHHHDSSQSDNLHSSQRINKQFDTESLSPGEQILAVIFVVLILIGTIAVLGVILFA